MKITNTGHVVRALTIAGSDSGGGAGVQADLKTMHQFGVYGMSTFTALTAQNTIGVQAIYAVTPDFVWQQLQSVRDDIGFDAVKTGMLATADIVHTVADFLQTQSVQNLVVDPVMVAKGGSSLLDPSAVDAVKRALMPLAGVVTPNIPEAEVICGHGIKSWHDCHQAAIEIVHLGAKAVVIKGGHMGNWSSELPGIDSGNKAVTVDLLYHDGTFTYFVTPNVQSAKTHGTGCTFSAAMTALLAQDIDLVAATAQAKSFVYDAIDSAKAWDVGSGHGPTDHSVPIRPLPRLASGSIYYFQSGTWVTKSF